MTHDQSAGSQLMRLMDGYLVTQLIHVAATLHLDVVLGSGARTAADLAAALAVDPPTLTRVLRGLATEGVLEEDTEGRFALTPVGAALGTLRGAALVRGDLYFRPAASLLEVVRHGGVAFEATYGDPFFDYLADHPGAASAFQSSMAGRSEREASDVAEAYDFTSLRLLVDVGGGQGVLLARILHRTPGLRGILIDRGSSVEAARRHLAEADLAARTECRSGDFFGELPAGADAYLLSRVLHDWSDPEARQILLACRRAIPDHGRLLVVDAVLPDRAIDNPAAIRMDLHMMLLFGSRERTEAELRALLADADFAVRRVKITASATRLAVIEAIPVQRDPLSG